MHIHPSKLSALSRALYTSRTAWPQNVHGHYHIEHSSAVALGSFPSGVLFVSFWSSNCRRNPLLTSFSPNAISYQKHVVCAYDCLCWSNEALFLDVIFKYSIKSILLIAWFFITHLNVCIQITFHLPKVTIRHRGIRLPKLHFLYSVNVQDAMAASLSTTAARTEAFSRITCKVRFPSQTL